MLAELRPLPAGKQPVSADGRPLPDIRRDSPDCGRPLPAGRLHKTSAQELSRRSPARSVRSASVSGAGGTLGATSGAGAAAATEIHSLTGARGSMTSALGVSHGMSAEVRSALVAVVAIGFRLLHQFMFFYVGRRMLACLFYRRLMLVSVSCVRYDCIPMLL